MKKAIDVKSLVIGVLATALFFTMIGAKSKNANFDTITAKKIRIVNPEGKVVAGLASDKEGGGVLGIFNKEGKVVAEICDKEGEGGGLVIRNEEGKTVAILGCANGEGALGILNKEGKPVVGLGSLDGGGTLGIYNKHGNEVAAVQANKEGDGAIYLFDRYGDLGWGMTGKK